MEGAERADDWAWPCPLRPIRAGRALHMCTDVNFLFVEILFFLPLWSPSPCSTWWPCAWCSSSEFAGHLPFPQASKHLSWPALVLWAYKAQGKPAWGLTLCSGSCGFQGLPGDLVCKEASVLES